MCFTGNSDCLRETVTKTFSILGAKGRKKPTNVLKKEEKKKYLFTMKLKTLLKTAKCILPIVKQITSPGWMHETSARAWCTGKTQRDRVEREVGGGNRDGEYV